VGNRLPQPGVQIDFRLPVKVPARQQYVGTPLHRIIGWQGLEFNGRIRSDQATYAAGNIQHCALARRPEVHRTLKGVYAVHQGHRPFGRVVHIAERTALPSLSVYRHARAIQGLDDKIRDYPSIALGHARPIRIENTRYLDLDALASATVREQG